MPWKTLLLRGKFNVWVQACVSRFSKMVVSNVRKVWENSSLGTKCRQSFAAAGDGNLLSSSLRLQPEPASAWLPSLPLALLPSPWPVARPGPDVHPQGPASTAENGKGSGQGYERLRRKTLAVEQQRCSGSRR